MRNERNVKITLLARSCRRRQCCRGPNCLKEGANIKGLDPEGALAPTFLNRAAIERGVNGKGDRNEEDDVMRSTGVER